MSRVTAAAAAVRQLVLVVAAVCLLGTGPVELAPRTPLQPASTAAGAPATGSVGRPAPVRPAAESSVPSPSLTLRAALAAFAPGSGGAAALPPGSCALVAPHLVARPVARPPASPCVLALSDGPSERAPPVPAGT